MSVWHTGQWQCGIQGNGSVTYRAIAVWHIGQWQCGILVNGSVAYRAMAVSHIGQWQCGILGNDSVACWPMAGWRTGQWQCGILNNIGIRRLYLWKCDVHKYLYTNKSAMLLSTPSNHRLFCRRKENFNDS